jgi:hypothetical protein
MQYRCIPLFRRPFGKAFFGHEKTLSSKYDWEVNRRFLGFKLSDFWRHGGGNGSEPSIPADSAGQVPGERGTFDAVADHVLQDN